MPQELISRRLARMRRNIVVAQLCLAVVACKGGGDVEPAASAKTVKCVPAQKAMLRAGIEVRGTVAPLPDRDAQVAPQVVGRILRIYLREGDPVTLGQV